MCDADSLLADAQRDINAMRAVPSEEFMAFFRDKNMYFDKCQHDNQLYCECEDGEFEECAASPTEVEITDLACDTNEWVVVKASDLKLARKMCKRAHSTLDAVRVTLDMAIKKRRRD